MSIRVSVLKRSIRPRSRSLTRGWVTPRILAACICRRRRPRTMSWTWSIRMERIRRCSASSREKPRSRNTLPLDGTIFIFMAGYPSSHQSTTTPVDYLAQAGPRQFNVSPGSPTGLLLKCVEDIDTLRKAGDVNHPMFPTRVHANLLGATSHALERLPIIRDAPLLDQPQLVTGYPSGLGREPFQV